MRIGPVGLPSKQELGALAVVAVVTFAGVAAPLSVIDPGEIPSIPTALNVALTVILFGVLLFLIAIVDTLFVGGDE